MEFQTNTKHAQRLAQAIGNSFRIYKAFFYAWSEGWLGCANYILSSFPKGFKIVHIYVNEAKELLVVHLEATYMENGTKTTFRFILDSDQFGSVLDQVDDFEDDEKSDQIIRENQGFNEP